MTSRYVPAVIASVVVIVDRWTKLWIEHRMGSFDEFSVVAGWFRIIHAENPGAAFGMLAEGNPALRSIVLIGISGLVLLFVASSLWRRNSSFQSASARVGLALILGGAVGNLYDRILRGTVTDFLEVYHHAWSFPAFNVADSAITVGGALLVLDLLRSRPKITHAA